jgi:general secretion pathway protein M
MRFDLAPAADWWASRTPRERVMLIVMACLLAVVLVWYGLIQPLRNGAAAAGQARSESARRLDEAVAAGRRIETLQARFGAARSPQALEALVVESAAQDGVTLDRLQADGAILTVWADAADPKTFLAWLARLQSQSGVGVTNFTAIPGAGGRVQMQAALAG